MTRHGFGGKTFAFEAEPDGVTPTVHVIGLPNNDAFYRADDAGNDGITQYNRVNAAASAAGVPLFADGQVWLLICESHMQRPDGSVVGGPFLGASFGNGSSGGVAMVSSASLSLIGPGGLTDARPYAGRIIPGVGPHPLVQDQSFVWFEGTTLSSVASSHMGGTLHEIGHALGLPHDFRNDTNFRGVLMGNGMRGFRSSGAVGPAWFADSDAWLARAHAQNLNVSRYFNVGQAVTDNVAPNLTITTAGSPAPLGGLLRVSFNASDAGGLATAMLTRNGDTIGELTLAGTSVTGATFHTPIYDAGSAQAFSVSVYDLRGNRRNADVTLTPAAPANRAPQPYVRVLPSTTLRPNQGVTLDASPSFDPDGSAATMTVEWDLDGNGTFDTAPTTSKTLGTSFPGSGTRLVIARLTDSAGAASISSPVPIHVSPDTMAPVADVVDVSPDPRDASVDVLSITFNEPVFGLDLGDLQLRRDGGPNLLTPSQTITTGDNQTFTLANLTGITAVSGSYALTLTAAGSQIIDAVGNAVAGNASDAWVHALPVWLAAGSDVTWNSLTKALNVVGAATLTADPGTDLPTVTANGAAATLSISPDPGTVVNFRSLQLSNGGSATVIAAGAGRVLVIDSGGSLVLDATAELDLTDNALAVHNAGAAAASASHTAINNLVRNAFHDFGWDLPGITSSTAAADAANGVPASLGILLNSDGAGGPLFYGPGTDQPAFMGVAVDANTVMVRFTRLGDGDLNGMVNSVDFSLFQAGYTGARPHVGYVFGDYDYNRTIDSVDFGLFQAGYAHPMANSRARFEQDDEDERLVLAAGLITA